MIRKSKSIRAGLGLATMLALLAGLVLFPSAGAQEASPGFDGYIQSGTCGSPTDDVWIELDSPRSDHAVQPYLAKLSGEDGTIALAYYGAPLAPGFGFSTIFTDQIAFSLVIADPVSGDPVACGDLLEPDDENFEQVGIALVRLDPVGASGLQGFAAVERTPTEMELDIISTRVRIILMTEPVNVAPPAGTPVASPVASPAASPEALS